MGGLYTQNKRVTSSPERDGAGRGSGWATAALFSPRSRSVRVSEAAVRPTLLSKRGEAELFGVDTAHFSRKALIKVGGEPKVLGKALSFEYRCALEQERDPLVDGEKAEDQTASAAQDLGG